MSRDCTNDNSGYTRPDTRSCYNCGQSGHLSRDCPTKQAGGYGGSSGYGGGSSGNVSLVSVAPSFLAPTAC